MIETFHLIRNLGQFDSVDTGRQLPLAKVALIYAENGRGKTTLAALLRSLGTGDPAPILERRRLGAANSPHIVIRGNGNATAMFQNGVWQQRFGQVFVFDDNFVAENICSGLKVETDHRQNLHELIIGGLGVALNRTLQDAVARIEQHNRELQNRGAAIPADLRGNLTVDAFCALAPRQDVEQAIAEAERNLAAGRQADEIQRHRIFSTISLPQFDLRAIEGLLSRRLQDLESAAAREVQEHISGLGERGESWVANGMTRIHAPTCPFCAQSISDSSLIAHYQAYFSDAYRNLKREIDETAQNLDRSHMGDAAAAFERAIAQAAQIQQFWSRFMHVDPVNPDTATITRSWKAAYEAIRAVLSRKQSSPLEVIELDEATRRSVAEYHQQCEVILRLNESLAEANQEIGLVKERAAAANVATLESDLRNLRVIRQRGSLETAALCEHYLTEKRAKLETEQARDQARIALNAHRDAVFPRYQTAINNYLQRFNAGFRLASVTSVNTRAGSSCNYSVLINAHEIPLSSGDLPEPCFRNSMSAGDRNTLALAFFFASLENEPNLDQTTIVIDDPMTSLDAHRSLTTIQEVRRLSGMVGQVLILSHSKPFLCAVWQELADDQRSAMRIARGNQSSILAPWDVRQDCITEHDRRHTLVSEYIANGVGANEREVAAALRPILEAFMRVAYPRHFPPGTLLGPFIGLCEQREGTQQQIMLPQDRGELRLLLDYANRFHHDTNAAWQTEIINDHELLDFSRRTIAFATK